MCEAESGAAIGALAPFSNAGSGWGFLAPSKPGGVALRLFAAVQNSAARTVAPFVPAHSQPGQPVREVELLPSFAFAGLGKRSNLPPSTVPLLFP